MTAPIALFVHARPEHTSRALEALRHNRLAASSDLIIYSDAAKTPAAQDQVHAVRELVHATSGFRSVRVVEREQNLGLSRNIVDGVTEVCERFGRVIVVEDDIVVGPSFLEYMNAALDKYEADPRVWHVSGWNYPMPGDGLGETFFWRVMNCWGWATWQDRWRHFEKDPAGLTKAWTQDQISRFNLDGRIDFWSQVEGNANGSLNTWAVFWYATIFQRSGLCLNPTLPLIENIGHDGSGENCGDVALRAMAALPEAAPRLDAEVAESRAAIANLDRQRAGRGLGRVANLLRGLLWPSRGRSRPHG